MGEQVNDRLPLRNATKQGFMWGEDGDSVILNYPNSTSRRGRVGKRVSQTLSTNSGAGVIVNKNGILKIRRLTPKEYFRLMGFSDSDVETLVENGISSTQIYKMAGNSIVVDVLEEIYCSLLNEYLEELELI